MSRLDQHLGPDAGPDDVYEAFLQWATESGIELYPHQDEAILELLGGANVVLATPTGSGKSLVAAAGILNALAGDRVSFYTAPIKALVNEKFFDLCALFGAENVGLLTGDSSVNPDAPIICCTAEILAHIALREGPSADVGFVVADEFHYYGDHERGWAWQVPLLELSNAQFLLMSATLGDVTEIRDDLTRRTGQETALVADAPRPVPLSFSWSLTPLAETVEELVTTHQAPVYVVHTTQAAAIEHARSLLQTTLTTREEKDAIAEKIGDFRFSAGFGKTLSRLLRAGIGVHHAGMLPKYRRLVEQLAQAGLLKVICGTDTLGVGINVPIRTVLFTSLAKFDGRRERILRTREFQQIAGRAGRAGFDTVGYVVVQAPEHVIENERAKAKSEAKNAANPKKKSKPQLKKAPPGTVVWSEQTFDKLVAGAPEQLRSRMKVDNAMLINVGAREEDAVEVLRRLLTDNHEPRANQVKLARRALRLTRSLLRSGVARRLDEPDRYGRRYVLTEDLPYDFALNQPLAHFALAALELLDPARESYPLDVVSVVESVLEAPRAILFAQQDAAKREAVAELKADGVEYDERMRLLDDITWPRPLADELAAAYELYRQGHPWMPEHAVDPKSIVREMYEQAMGFHDFISRYQLARSEGLLLRYLTDAYRTLRQTVPESARTPELDDIEAWLRETVRQVDSSLLDEWTALADPSAAAATREEAVSGPPPLSSQERVLKVMVRSAMLARVQHISLDRVDALVAADATAAGKCDPPREPVMTRAAWDAALDAYYDEHESLIADGDARSLANLRIEPASGPQPGGDPDIDARLWNVRQTLLDPEGNRDWVVDAVVDLDATDAAGELVLLTTAMHRL
ncbi:RNA helicase [Blastococcus sp. Marseille-P5729]|uniref:DEAD/DEAH box helicase n=1 Tax=Blastococcus sp. Marseille-P5729 TaxID=2086582 RepID=UPI000D10E6BD|nr:DEAD/DEAH box helicase [Blastococcus sp. Marseille-P5729]